MGTSLPSDFNEKVRRLLEDNRDTDEWDWPDNMKCTWTLFGRFQDFCDHWREGGAPNFLQPNTLQEFPYILDFGRGEVPFLNTINFGENRIIVTEAYIKMLHRILYDRAFTHSRGGIVLTGQPGVGKTTFLAFVLAQLILAKQAVLLVFPTQLYLFYCGKAYYRNDLDFNTIPLRGIRGRMWALINSDSKKEGVVLDVGFRIWPIQASSPRPERWKSWITQFNGNLWGMPLWEMDELNKGLCLHSSFHDFQESLNLSLNPAGPVNNNSLIKYALDVLQRKVVRDGDTTGRPQVTGQVLGVDVEAVLKTLVEHATEEFGFAPCDVYRAVFEPVGVKGEHNAAMAALDHSMLTKFVTDFHRGERPDILSHKVITVKPIMLDLLSPDRWVIDFKSPQIARNAVEHLRREEMGVLRELFYLFKRILYGGSLAGRVFEAMAHRKFLDGWQQSDGPAPPYIRMRSNKADPPVFSTDPFNGPDESPMPAPLSANVKKAIQVDLGRSVPPQDVTLAEDQYYIPAADNNPLFDSFTVHHDGGSTFVITIIQITISEKHGGAAEGYLQIRRIMKRVKELVEEEHSGALVRVAYCLVCPEGNVKNVWAMPAGWEECTRVDDHRGPVFYLRIPGSVLVHVENQIDEGKS